MDNILITESAKAADEASRPRGGFLSVLTMSFSRFRQDLTVIAPEIILNYSRKGGFKDLPGKGKPVQIEESDDLYTRTLKSSNLIPAWLALRKEIVRDMKTILDNIQTNDEDQIEQLNQKIRKYNRQVPNPLLQKGVVTSQNIQEKYEKWL
ncbi:DnaJ family domain-containing protein [Paenibacillus caui]|uniref:DnaJ family domain-containing protein n=1 Tax=Paenibacillus caui TaxID=2873927 RepID=UPI001CA9EB3C|nr:DnaJ family domain-containing protein [Paenibacillus caui]